MSNVQDMPGDVDPSHLRQEEENTIILAGKSRASIGREVLTSVSAFCSTWPPQSDNKPTHLVSWTVSSSQMLLLQTKTLIAKLPSRSDYFILYFRY